MTHAGGVARDPHASLIELDVSTPWEAPRERIGRRDLTRWRSVALVLAVVLCAAPSSNPSAVPLSPVLAVSGSAAQLRFGEGLVYVLTEPGAGAGTLTGYSLGDDGTGAARPLWSVALGRFGGSSWFVDGDLVVLSRERRTARWSVGDDLTQAFDGRTGAVRWEASGFGVIAPVGETVVVRESSPLATEGDVRPDPGRGTGGAGATDRLDRQVELRALDRRTGVPRWSRTIPAGTLVAERYDRRTGNASGPIAELDRAGRLRVTDPLTGEALSETGIDRPDGTVAMWFAGDRIMLLEPGVRGVTTVEYGAVTGRRGAGSAPASGPVLACGEYVCRSAGMSADERFLVVTDPETGVERWRWPGGDDFVVLDDRVLAAYGLGGGASGVHLFDLGAGRLVRSFDGWQLVDGDPRQRPLVGQNGAGRFTLGRADFDRGGIEVLGRVDGWFGSAGCRVAARFAGCASASRIVVWRLPPRR